MKAAAFITENTGISLGVLISMAGIVVWLGSFYANDVAQAKDIQMLQKQVDSQDTAIRDMGQSLQKILDNTNELKLKMKLLVEDKHNP